MKIIVEGFQKSFIDAIFNQEEIRIVSEAMSDDDCNVPSNMSEPIELPSDEEIKEYLKKTHTKAVNPLNVYYKTGFESGAIWMKEQILNQNK